MESASKNITVLYYDSDINSEDIFEIYQTLKVKFPDLVILPNSTRLKNEPLSELKKIRDNLNVIIDFLTD